MRENERGNKAPLGVCFSIPALLKKLIYKWIFFAMIFSVITLFNLSLLKFVSLFLQGAALYKFLVSEELDSQLKREG